MQNCSRENRKIVNSIHCYFIINEYPNYVKIKMYTNMFANVACLLCIYLNHFALQKNVNIIISVQILELTSPCSHSKITSWYASHQASFRGATRGPQPSRFLIRNQRHARWFRKDFEEIHSLRDSLAAGQGEGIYPRTWSFQGLVP